MAATLIAKRRHEEEPGGADGLTSATDGAYEFLRASTLVCIDPSVCSGSNPFSSPPHAYVRSLVGFKWGPLGSVKGWKG